MVHLQLLVRYTGHHTDEVELCAEDPAHGHMKFIAAVLGKREDVQEEGHDRN